MENNFTVKQFAPKNVNFFGMVRGKLASKPYISKTAEQKLCYLKLTIHQAQPQADQNKMFWFINRVSYKKISTNKSPLMQNTISH